MFTFFHLIPVPAFSNIIVTGPAVLLCSMSTSHRFSLKNYKDSWNSGPPWAECALCHQDVPSDGSLACNDKQSDLNELPSPLAQDPELLSPQAPEFHPTSYYQPYSHFGRDRLYRPLPSRRNRGQLATRRPTRLASYRGVRPGHSTTHYFTAAEATDATNLFPTSGVNQQAGYQGAGSLNHQLGGDFQVWNSAPRQSRAHQQRIQGDSDQEPDRSALLHQDIGIQPLPSVPQPQLNLPGV